MTEANNNTSTTGPRPAVGKMIYLTSPAISRLYASLRMFAITENKINDLLSRAPFGDTERMARELEPHKKELESLVNSFAASVNKLNKKVNESRNKNNRNANKKKRK